MPNLEVGGHGPMAQQRRRFEGPKLTTKKTSEKHFFSYNGKSIEISQQLVKKIEVWDWIYFGLFAFSLVCREGDSVWFFSFSMRRKLNDFCTTHGENEPFSTSNNFYFYFFPDYSLIIKIWVLINTWIC